MVVSSEGDSLLCSCEICRCQGSFWIKGFFFGVEAFPYGLNVSGCLCTLVSRFPIFGYHLFRMGNHRIFKINVVRMSFSGHAFTFRRVMCATRKLSHLILDIIGASRSATVSRSSTGRHVLNQTGLNGVGNEKYIQIGVPGLAPATKNEKCA